MKTWEARPAPQTEGANCRGVEEHGAKAGPTVCSRATIMIRRRLLAQRSRLNVVSSRQASGRD